MSTRIRTIVVFWLPLLCLVVNFIMHIIYRFASIANSDAKASRDLTILPGIFLSIAGTVLYIGWFVFRQKTGDKNLSATLLVTNLSTPYLSDDKISWIAIGMYVFMFVLGIVNIVEGYIMGQQLCVGQGDEQLAANMNTAIITMGAIMCTFSLLIILMLYGSLLNIVESTDTMVSLESVKAQQAKESEQKSMWQWGKSLIPSRLSEKDRECDEGRPCPHPKTCDVWRVTNPYATYKCYNIPQVCNNNEDCHPKWRCTNRKCEPRDCITNSHCPPQNFCDPNGRCEASSENLFFEEMRKLRTQDSTTT